MTIIRYRENGHKYIGDCPIQNIKNEFKAFI